MSERVFERERQTEIVGDRERETEFVADRERESGCEREREDKYYFLIHYYCYKDFGLCPISVESSNHGQLLTEKKSEVCTF